MTDRILDWDSCYNVRDLGGLPLIRGGETRMRGFVRSSAVFELTEAGWAAAQAYGIRTVIDLMSPDGYAPDAAARPAEIETVRVPLDDMEDHDFWDPLVSTGHWCTAIYYPAFLRRYPETVGRTIKAIADAGPGGILFHCGRGQDRTGIVAMLLLAAAGVRPDAIADDYDLSHSPDTVRRRVAKGLRDDSGRIGEIVAEAGTTNRDTIIATLAGIAIEDYLAEAGVVPNELGAIRERLI